MGEPVELSEKLMQPGVQTVVADAVITATGGAQGLTVTVTVTVAEQPFTSVTVIVYVDVAAGLAVTVAPDVALSPVAGLQAYIVPPVTVMLILPPVHITGAAGFAVGEGKGFTVTVTAAVAVHPLASVPVTVYVVVATGLAVGFAPVVALNPVAGVHV